MAEPNPIPTSPALQSMDQLERDDLVVSEFEQFQRLATVEFDTTDMLVPERSVVPQ